MIAEQSDSGGDFESLRLKVLDDMRNNSLAACEKPHSWNLSQIGVGESYVDGRTYIKVSVTSLAEGKQYDFIICRGHGIGEQPASVISEDTALDGQLDCS